jgi:hypothetical protein
MIFAINPIQPPISGMSAGQEKAPQAFATFFSALIGFILFLATIFTLLQLLLAGFQWISSGGDKGLLEVARNRILNSLIGLIILFAAWAVFLVILQFLGLTGAGGSINLSLPTLFKANP